MIALWMIYAIVIALFVGLSAALLERCLRLLRVPLRGAWLAAMVVIPLIVVSAALPNSATQSRTADIGSLGALAYDADNLPHAAHHARLSPGVWWRAAKAQVLAWQRSESSRAFRRAAESFDTPLLALWVLASTTLLAALWRGAQSGSRHRIAASSRPSQQFNGVDVFVTEATGPSAVGVIRPRILIPGWTDDLEPSLKSLMLEHEWQHARVRDPAILTFAALVLVTMPWNIAMWWAIARLRLAIELDCDSRVLRRHNDVQRYGRLLLFMNEKLSLRKQIGGLAHLGAPSMQPSRTQLSRRIVAMTRLNIQPSVQTIAVAVATAAVAIAIAACASDIPSPIATPPSVASTAVAKAEFPIFNDVNLTTRDGRPARVRVFGVDGASVLVRRNAVTLSADTMMLTTPVTFRVDLTSGDVHFVSVDGPQLVMDAKGNGPASSTGARGTHFYLVRGGRGVATVSQ